MKLRALAWGAVALGACALLVGTARAEAGASATRPEATPTATPTPAPTPEKPRAFTNDDLKKYEGQRPSESASRPSSTSESSGSKTRNRDEEVWGKRAASAREDIRKAEAHVAELEDKLRALTLDIAPNSGDLLVQDRLGQREREKAKVSEELEAARKDVDTARQRLADLEEEARRKSVPPGWLREP